VRHLTDPIANPALPATAAHGRRRGLGCEWTVRWRRSAVDSGRGTPTCSSFGGCDQQEGLSWVGVWACPNESSSIRQANRARILCRFALAGARPQGGEASPRPFRSLELSDRRRGAPWRRFDQRCSDEVADLGPSSHPITHPEPGYSFKRNRSRLNRRRFGRTACDSAFANRSSVSRSPTRPRVARVDLGRPSRPAPAAAARQPRSYPAPRAPRCGRSS
jgi:hypothetical protein